MSEYHGPLDIPFIGGFVTQAVRLFAEKNKLECELWYHDEPIWLATKQTGENFYQQVQVAAFRGAETAPQLFFIPFAFVVRGNKNSITPLDPKNAQSIELAGLFRQSPQQIVETIYQSLGVAWLRAAAFERSDANA
jgi:hypothetical protein